MKVKLYQVYFYYVVNTGTGPILLSKGFYKSKEHAVKELGVGFFALGPAIEIEVDSDNS